MKGSFFYISYNHTAAHTASNLQCASSPIVLTDLIAMSPGSNALILYTIALLYLLLKSK